MLRPLLPLLLLLNIQAHAQKIISVDSVALFRIGSDMNNRSNSILLSKGTITGVKPDATGKFAISVFKQHNGVLALDPSVKRKGLVSGVAVLPGLAQYTYGEDGLQLVKEKTFSLNTGLKEPFKYKFTEANGALNKTQAKEVEKVLGSEELGGDYNRLLQMAPEAVGYKGDTWTYTSFAMNKAGNGVEYTKIPFEYLPLIAGYDARYQGPVSFKNFPVKINPRATFAFAHKEAGKVNFLGPVSEEKIAVMTIDTTGKQTEAAIIPLKKGMDIATAASVQHQAKGQWISNRGAAFNSGVDLLLSTAVADKKKGTDYALVRLDAGGNVLYHHPFKLGLEDYDYERSEIYANETETIAKITLRKNVLKAAIFYVKIGPEGVLYTNRYEMKLSLKLYTPDGRQGIMGGASSVQQLITLPDGENLLWGYMEETAPEKVGQLASYGSVHLDKNGVYKAYYNAKTLVPENARNERPRMTHYNLADGRVLVVVNEPRNYAGSSFQQFSLLDAELCKNFSIKPEDLEPDMKNVLFYTGKYTNLPAAPPPPPTGSKLLNKVAALNDAPARDTDGPYKRRQQMEDEQKGYVPSLYIIDVKNTSIKHVDFMRAGGYSIFNQPVVWVNRESGETLTFLRTPPLPLDPKKGAYPYPMDVYLKIIKMKL